MNQWISAQAVQQTPTYMQHARTHRQHIYMYAQIKAKNQLCWGAWEEKKRLLCLLLPFNCLAATNRPSSPFHTWEWAQARTLQLFIQWGWWRDIRQTSTHSCFCALFLEAGRKSAEFSASVTAAAGHCDDPTRDMEAFPDKMPVSNCPLVRLHAVKSHLDGSRLT